MPTIINPTNTSEFKIETTRKGRLKSLINGRSVQEMPRGFRRLKWNEVVTPGDYIMDENREIELWEGPGGFHADPFLKPIYRKHPRLDVKKFIK